MELASKILYEGNVEHDIIYNPLVNCNQLSDTNFKPVNDYIVLEHELAESPNDKRTTRKNFETRYRPLVDKWYDVT